MSAIPIFIVEDNRGIRNAMVTYLSKYPELFSTIFVFDSVEEFLESTHETAEILLLDINLPGMSGIDGIVPIKNKFPSIQIIIISVMTDSESIFKSICAGAAGYIDKDAPLSEIKEAIVDVLNGGSAITPSIARKVFDYFQPTHTVKEDLSHRELEVVTGIVDGLSYKLIADKIGVTINTIRKYIRQIYGKLEINSKGELIAKYYKANNNL